MIELIIDGKTVIVKDGMTVLEVAKATGIYIPSLCYHPYISPAGTCRLCAVEVEGMRGLPCSCTLPAAEGMVVHTDTPRVREFRRTLLECILSEHPRDCLVCPANLQCELQEVAAQIELERAKLPSIPRGSQPKLGTNNIDHSVRLCHAPTVVGLAQSFGSGAMTNSIVELGEAACILAIGTNTTVAHPVIALEMKKAVRRGANSLLPIQSALDSLRELTFGYGIRREAMSLCLWV